MLALEDLGDAAELPECGVDPECPLADPAFNITSDVLIEAQMAGCRCQDPEFLSLFERSRWWPAAAQYMNEKEAGVAASPEKLTCHQRKAVSLLNQIVNHERNKRFRREREEAEHPHE